MVGLSAALPKVQTLAEQRVLFYPASGFDWKVPLALFRLCSNLDNLPRPNCCIYVDYSRRLAGQLERTCATGDYMYWGPEVKVEAVCPIEPPAEWVWHMRSRGKHAPEGGSLTGDCWYVLDLRLATYLLPILYVPGEAVAFVFAVMGPLRFRPTYVATVTDGCRQGGNWCCLSKKDGPFHKAMEESGVLPDYWLADHGDLGFPEMAKVKTGVYGKGESKLMLVE